MQTYARSTKPFRRRYAALTRFALIGRSFRMKKYSVRSGLIKNIIRNEYQEINIEGNIKRFQWERISGT